MSDAAKMIEQLFSPERRATLGQHIAPPGDDCCEYCNDGDGHCAYPIYGLAPHYHECGNSAVSIFGSTRFLPRERWPANFREDAEAPNSGTYTHCPVCGRGGDE